MSLCYMALSAPLVTVVSCRNWDTVRVNIDNKSGQLDFTEDGDHVFSSMVCTACERAVLSRFLRLFGSRTSGRSRGHGRLSDDVARLHARVKHRHTVIHAGGCQSQHEGRRSGICAFCQTAAQGGHLLWLLRGSLFSRQLHAISTQNCGYIPCK